MSTAWRVLGLLSAVMLLSGITACDDSIRGRGTATFQANPPTFTFPKVAIDSNLERTVVITNTGDAELIIASVDFQAGSDEFELNWQESIDGPVLPAFPRENNDNLLPDRIRIKAGESRVFILDYAPSDDDFNDAGVLVFITNVGEKKIPIRISDAGAEINVNPRVVDFEQVGAGESESQAVNVVNVGQVVLEIDKVLLNGSQDFTPLINDKDPRRFPDILDDPDEDGEPGLAPNASFTITVRYAPPAAGPDLAELSIFSNDPNQREVKVALQANGATPCLGVSPSAVVFNTSLVNRTDSRPLSLESCGGNLLEITRIYLSDDSDPAFEVDMESLPEFPAILPAVVPGEVPPSRRIQVAFTPFEQRIYNGTLIIESNDTLNPVRRVSLLGRGVLNACPQARATKDAFSVLPLDVVVLDGSISIDLDGPNNKPVEYEWVITSRPDGSSSQPVENFFDNLQPANGGPEDDRSTPTALFFVDIAGTYTAELRVRDNLGLDSTACENPAIVTISATPEQAIHIQLVWRTPNDPDETDTHGTDLDLHLLHPLANAEFNWFSSPHDCYFGNAEPDWGQLDNPADDPTIDIDDINGAGPENVNLDEPENTAQYDDRPYLVGVHYYSSADRQTQEDYGSSFATVRIFIRGELAWDSQTEEGVGEQEMEVQDAFWKVAAIHWPEGRVETKNQYENQRP